MEDRKEKVEKYKANMNIIIRSDNPIYVTYVSNEYMRLIKEDPSLALEIQNLIKLYSKKPNSIYSKLVDKDGTINFEAISDFSKVSNISELAKNIEALTGQNIDLSTVTSDEIISSGMEIAENLAREADNIESSIDFESGNVDESVVTGLEEQTENAVQIASRMGAAGAGILGIIAAVRSKIANILGKIRNGKNKAHNKENINNEKINSKKTDLSNSNKDVESFVPKVTTPVINKIIKKEEKESIKNKKGFNVDGTDDYDPSDDDVYDIDE